MSIRVAVNHQTHYYYDRTVSLSPHIFRLRPAAHCRTPIEAYSLNIEPENHFINWQQDPFGNYLARVVFLEKAEQLSIKVDLVAEMTVINPFDFFIESDAEIFPFDYDSQLKKELSPYLVIRESGSLLADRVKKIDRSPEKTVDFLVELNRQVQQEIDYTIRLKPGVQTCEETLSLKRGSCRDTAWLLIQLLRHVGLAARFVSGYLIQLTADVKSLDGPSGPEKDFTDLHAWAEVYVPGAGWLGLDPTSGLFAGEGHIPLACTPDPQSAAPVAGSTDPCETKFTYNNSVMRIHEDPRVTKPYSEEDWEAINALGLAVDEKLAENDVRLCMGGEPTFVSIDDMEAEEWNTAADGSHKRSLANELIMRLHKQFANDGIIHCGQGKWYPGEPLPRWQLACFWIKNGNSLWKKPELFADISKSGKSDIHDAERFISGLTKVLKIDPAFVRAGYEDMFYLMWEEQRLPKHVDPMKADIDDPMERKHLADLLSRGIKKPTGFALPLRWNHFRNTWESSSWEFRRDEMFLLPGNSSMGFRLPLESLSWSAPKKKIERKEQKKLEPDPGAEINPEPDVYQFWKAGYEDTSWMDGDLNDEVVHTALCVEPRDGRLHVFFPPVHFFEPWVQLVDAVEKVAETFSMPLVLEGYEPPNDPRIQRLMVTPDPGVIEVNIHPSQNWPELVKNTETLYKEAYQARLGTEKFMIDGRHTGTGGGNHVTIGGPAPEDSPMLRRPDLFRSLITYWQHHPGLSYLFAGLFVGPTSQAPRVDEARDEMLYELEIALDQLPKKESPEPWLVDRLLRHLMVDLTGNTHRAEFSIDKLYPLETPQRRLGLVEFRAFDMPPHYRMSLVQMLLIRTLIVRFWNHPYHKRLVRWGTELHDRFMLHQYVRDDIKQVVSELQQAGYPFKMNWLDAFFEFRFPKYGMVDVGNIRMELRMGIEPWHVLGEEITSAGTARFVDSSVERLQVKLTGLTDSRYVVTCNQRRVPLHSTGVKGEYVGGIRYRAWQPPSALHPTIPVHSPLIFDIIDTWNGRAIGGCTYFVSHPGGRNYTTYPVNACEAESRRFCRFWNYGHSPGYLEPPPDLGTIGRFFPQGHPPGPMEPPSEEINPEYPYTLDLRCNPSLPL